MMKDNQDNNNSNIHKRREKPKRHVLRRFICLFFVLCCCILICAVGLIANDFLLSKDNQPKNEQPASSFFTNPATDFSANLPLHTQNHADETVLIAGKQINIDETAWYLVLVNKSNHIPDDYEVELTELANGQSVDKRIYPSLQKMFDTARSNNVHPVVASGYRTAKEQQGLLDAKIAEYRAEGYSAKEAQTKAEAWVAAPGASEHQLGIAVDINADGIHSKGDEVYEWLNRNAYKFGFIRRYPPNKTEMTGVSNEPWHYRYVGIDAATEIHKKGVCLEEYLNEPLSEASGGKADQRPGDRMLPPRDH